MNNAGLQSSTGWLHLFGDPTRLRLMALLEQQELSVAELTSITDLGQSRVSTHLGKLKEAGLLRDRPVGPSTFYRMAEAGIPAPALKLWEVLRDQIRDDVLVSDQTRCQALLQARERGWPDVIAGQMERHYSPGRTWESMARTMLGFVELGDVLDVGCGDGTTAQLVAPQSRSYTGVDVRPRVIEAARQRLQEPPCPVALYVGDMHALPFDGERFDQAFLLHVLTFSETPSKAIAEAARVLRPGGVLALATLAEHGHAETTATYGHVNTGFRPAALRRLLRRAGLDVRSCGVTSRERRAPHFAVVTAFARK
jgi:SAM-dependent methyltransferase